MTRAAVMRAWLAEHGPATAGAIREALQLTPKQIKSTLFQLLGDGMVVAEGPRGARRYAVGREAREWGRQAEPGVLEARKQRRNERNATRRRKHGRTMAQIKADAIQRRIDAMAAKVAAKVAADNAARRADNEAQDRRDAARADQRSKLDALATLPDLSQVDRPETVAEWQARTGGQIDVLADGEVSPANRLRFIGARA